MNAKQNNLHILLSILFLCVGITLFHVRGITAQNKRHNHKNASQRPLESLNAQDTLDYVMPLLISGNINGAATLLTQSDPETRKQLINLLLKQDKTSLSSHNKLLFLLAIAHAYASNRPIQNEIFEMIEQQKENLPYTSTLLYATQNDYQSVLEALISWINQQGPESFAQSLLIEGIKTIIEINNPDILHLLFDKNISLTMQEATELLYMAILEQKNARFIPLLVSAGADVNAVDTALKTLLMHAVELDNVAIAHALLKEGANPNIITSPLIGSALQRAVEMRHVKMELLLRQYGGKE